MKYKEYSKVSAISAHGIIEFMKSPWHYYHKYVLKDTKDDFHVEGKDLLGSAADCLLTTPDDFNEIFTIIDVDAIGGKTGEVIMKLSQRDFGGLMSINDWEDADIQPLCDEADIKGGVKWFRNKVSSDKKYQEFYDKLVAASQTDKKIITSEMFNQAKAIQIQVLSDHIVGCYFRNDCLNAKMFYQVPVFFDYKGLQCKILIDLVVMSSDKRSFVLGDLKTTSQGIYKYEDVVIKDKLFIQGGFYSLPFIRELDVKTPVEELQELWKGKFPKGAHLEDFTFITADSTGYESPTEFSLGGHNSSQIKQIIEGGKFKSGREFKGIDAILEEMKWHHENNLWEHTKEYYENKQVKLNIFQ